MAVGPCTSHLNQVVNFVNNRLIAERLRHGDRLGHAAAVVRGEQGIAIAGESGLGKSTLLLHLIHRGAAFLANDRLLLHRSQHRGPAMLSVPQWPRVNPGTLMSIPRLQSLISEADRQSFRSLPADEHWALEQKTDVRIDRVFPHSLVVPDSGLSQLVFLNWQRRAATGTCQLRPVRLAERPDLLKTLGKSLGVVRNPQSDPDHAAQTDRATLRDLLQGCPAHELVGGIDMASASERIESLVDAR